MPRFLKTPPKKSSKDEEWASFLRAKLPILWIIGPSQAGKTALAHVLVENSNYRIMHLRHHSSIPGERPREKVVSEKKDVETLKSEIKHTFKFCSGYIIDDFPSNFTEYKEFTKKVCKPTVIIYISIGLDAVLARTLASDPTVDINTVRMDFVKQSKFCEKMARRYKKSNKVVSIFSQYPIREVHAKAFEVLENEYSFKFKTK